MDPPFSPDPLAAIEELLSTLNLNLLPPHIVQPFIEEITSKASRPGRLAPGFVTKLSDADALEYLEPQIDKEITYQHYLLHEILQLKSPDRRTIVREDQIKVYSTWAQMIEKWKMSYVPLKEMGYDVVLARPGIFGQPDRTYTFPLQEMFRVVRISVVPTSESSPLPEYDEFNQDFRRRASVLIEEQCRMQSISQTRKICTEILRVLESFTIRWEIDKYKLKNWHIYHGQDKRFKMRAFDRMITGADRGRALVAPLSAQIENDAPPLPESLIEDPFIEKEALNEGPIHCLVPKITPKNVRRAFPERPVYRSPPFQHVNPQHLQEPY